MTAQYVNCPFDRRAFTATVQGHIAGVGQTIRIESIAFQIDRGSWQPMVRRGRRGTAVRPVGRVLARPTSGVCVAQDAARGYAGWAARAR